MFTLIAITVMQANAQGVREVLAQCCAETGDFFEGLRYYSEIDEISYFVRLKEGTHLSRHLTVLDQALQQGMIVSFQPALYEHDIRLLCSSSCAIDELLHEFPLRTGQTWFQALSDRQTAYICTRRSLLQPQQSAWLIEQKIRWEYI